jgi:hypothetical protein
MNEKYDLAINAKLICEAIANGEWTVENIKNILNGRISETDGFCRDMELAFSIAVKMEKKDLINAVYTCLFMGLWAGDENIIFSMPRTDHLVNSLDSKKSLEDLSKEIERLKNELRKGGCYND